MPPQTATKPRKLNLLEGLTLPNIAKWLGIALLVFVLFTVTYLYAIDPFQKPSDVRVTNMSDRSATISWVTDKPAKGAVIYGEKDSFMPGLLASVGQGIAYDDRDVAKAVLEGAKELEDDLEARDTAISSSELETDVSVTALDRYYVHHVTVKGLDPEKEYFFMVGDGVRFDSGTFADDEFSLVQDNSLITFSELEDLENPNPTYGKVVSGFEGDKVEDSIIYLRPGYDTPSAPLSAVTNSEGNWYIDFSNSRSADGETLMSFDEEKDKHSVFVEAGKFGESLPIIEPMYSDAPMVDITVSNDWDETQEDTENSFIFKSFAKEEKKKDKENKVDERNANKYNENGKIKKSYADQLKRRAARGDYVDPDDVAAAAADHGIIIAAPSKQEPATAGGSNGCYSSRANEVYEGPAGKDYICCSGGLWTPAVVDSSGNTVDNLATNNAECVRVGRGKPVEASGSTAPGCYNSQGNLIAGVSSPYYCSEYGGTWDNNGDGVVTTPEQESSIPICYTPDGDPIVGVKDVHDCDRRGGLWEEDGLLGDQENTSGGCTVGGVSYPDLSQSQCYEKAEGSETSYSFNGQDFYPNWNPNVKTGNECPNEDQERIGKYGSTGYRMYVCRNGKWAETNQVISAPAQNDNLNGRCEQDGYTFEDATDAESCEILKNGGGVCTIFAANSQTGELYTDYVVDDEFECRELGTELSGEAEFYESDCVIGGNVYPTTSERSCDEIKDELEENGTIEVTVNDGCGTEGVKSDSGSFECRNGRWLAVVSENAEVRFVEGGCFLNGRYITNRCQDGGNGISAVSAEVPCPSGSSTCVCADGSTGYGSCIISDVESVAGEVGTHLEDGEDCPDGQVCYCEGGEHELLTNGDLCEVESSIIKPGSLPSFLRDVSAQSSIMISPDKGVFAIEQSGIYCTTYEGEEYCFNISTTGDKFLYIDSNSNRKFDSGDINISSGSEELSIGLELKTNRMNLKEGFNLVSFDFVSADMGTTAKEWLTFLNKKHNNAFYSLAKFESGKWVVVSSKEGEIYGANDFQIVPGVGYLLKSRYDLSLNLSGKAVLDSVPLKLETGWNLIGINGAENSYTAESLIDDINSVNGVVSDNVTRWDTSVSRYLGLQKDASAVYGIDFPLTSSSAYFVRVTEGSGVWTPQ
jgi:hypothetical protein